ncbi:hypothetical protein HHK36_032601 [Tetracentron sinense]|uniref:K Homology domain-containing protein n=1 Tax=Tetracentron sinense TaxID=13715 RepID=A0A835CZE3_TETSI|nr:hypothetical protein HHK36_032601 [Tetracentron sinense]
MEGPFLSPPAKRPFYNVSGFPETNPHSANGVSKRGRPKPPPAPIVLSPGNAAFRLLCHVSKIGGVIGKSGSIVKQLQQETGSKIRIEEAVASCEERIVLIVGPDSLTKNITLKGSNGEDEEEVSCAQEALFRVFERVLEVEAETDGILGESISCRLLAAISQIGAVMGKGGKIIKKIRKESGAKISVLSVEQLPVCASQNEQVIQGKEIDEINLKFVEAQDGFRIEGDYSF